MANDRALYMIKYHNDTDIDVYHEFNGGSFSRVVKSENGFPFGQWTKIAESRINFFHSYYGFTFEHKMAVRYRPSVMAGTNQRGDIPDGTFCLAIAICDDPVVNNLPNPDTFKVLTPYNTWPYDNLPSPAYGIQRDVLVNFRVKFNIDPANAYIHTQSTYHTDQDNLMLAEGYDYMYFDEGP